MIFLATSIHINQTCSYREHRNSRTKMNHEFEIRVGVGRRTRGSTTSGSTTERKKSGDYHRPRPRLLRARGCETHPLKGSPEKEGCRGGLSLLIPTPRYSSLSSSPFSSPPPPSSSSPPPPLPDPRRRRGLLPWSSHSKLERERRGEESRAEQTRPPLLSFPFPSHPSPPLPSATVRSTNQPSSCRPLLVETRGISSRRGFDWMQLVATLRLTMDSRQRANLVESLPGHVSITYASEGYVRRRRSPYRRIYDNVLYLNYLFLPLFPLQTLSFVKGLILRFHGFLSPFSSI